MVDTMPRRLCLETEVRDIPRRVATLVDFYHRHDDGKDCLRGKPWEQVATMILDLEHAGRRLEEAFDAEFFKMKKGSPPAVDLEPAIGDVAESMAILEVVAKFITDRQPNAWSMVGLTPLRDHTLYVLNSGHSTALESTILQLSRNVRALYAAFHGEDGP